MSPFNRARSLAHERFQAWLQGTPIHHPDKTLVIIDMQDHFLTQNDKGLISRVCELVEYARQKKWAIILVEMESDNKTIKEILDAVGDYPHQATVVKSGMDGGREVIECINSKKTWSLNILICGVYGDQCVSRTVSGLFDNSDLVEVDVIGDAVNPAYSSSSEEDEYGQQREAEVAMEDVCVNIQGLVQ